MLGDGKAWFLSRGVLGPIINVLCLVLAAVFGIQIDEATATVVVDQVIATWTALAILGGTLLGLWGRIKATRRIGGGAGGARALALMLGLLLAAQLLAPGAEASAFLPVVTSPLDWGHVLKVSFFAIGVACVAFALRSGVQCLAGHGGEHALEGGALLIVAGVFFAGSFWLL